MVLFMRTQIGLTKHARKVELELFVARDARLRALRQAIHAIRAVKFYAWERQYTALLARLRDAEVARLRTNRVCMVSSVCLGKAFPVLATCLTLLATAGARGDASVGVADAFATLALFQQLRIGIGERTNLHAVAPAIAAI